MFSTADRQALVAEWNRLSGEPPPPDRRSVGCMMVVLAIAGFIATPFVVGLLGGKAVPRAMLWIWGAVLLAGAFMSLVLTSSLYSRYAARAREAIDWLAANGEGGDPVARRNMAVSLLFHAYCSDGPSTSTTFDFEEAKPRIAAALPYVMEVERCLAIDLKIYRVFTDDKVKLPG